MAYQPLDTSTAEPVAERLRVIAHPQRLRILHLLRANTHGLSVTNIYKGLDIAQAIASQHLILLKDKGVLVSMKEGTHIYYKVAEAVRPLVDALLTQLAT